jgi:hypothetical protein
MDDGWIGRARRRLVALADGGCWGYRRGAPTSPEATALAALGLLATAADPDTRSLVLRAGDGLARLQRRDGSLGVVATLTMPGWATAFAMLLWQAVGGFEEQRRRAADWLLGERVATTARAADPDGITGHDPSVPGWPWVEDTHPWVEPTAMALLALAREGFIGHPRVADGVRLLRDRQIATGGWNYGNTAVFGRTLRPQPAPTGLSLLALAACGVKREEVGKSLDDLQESLPGVRAAISLAWGVLGLRAWGRCPTEAEGWLSESALAALSREDAAPRLGLLLIASGTCGIGLLVPKSLG